MFLDYKLFDLALCLLLSLPVSCHAHGHCSFSFPDCYVFVCSCSPIHVLSHVSALPSCQASPASQPRVIFHSCISPQWSPICSFKDQRTPLIFPLNAISLCQYSHPLGNAPNCFFFHLTYPLAFLCSKQNQPSSTIQCPGNPMGHDPFCN